MRTEEHRKAFEEYKKNIFETAITRGIEHSQRTIGFSASRGIIELLSIYLHSINKLDAGAQLNHRWFKTENVVDRLPDFPKKTEIIAKMVLLENLSESLSYGSQKSNDEIVKVIELFQNLEKIISEMMK